MPQFQLNLAPERKIWSVTELTARIRDLLARNFTDIWVQGEISNSHEAQSGHFYFTLKDAKAQVRCVCFKSQVRLFKFHPEDGLHVTLRGSISVYEPRGDAVRDIVRILRRRFPNVRITLYPVRVQGEGAAAEIAGALAYFNRQKLADVLILARGGGSLEDLQAFNEESVARAIAASKIPVISGVGHETDFTIADFVADMRASTPSAAAELVVQTRREFDRHISELLQTLAQRLRYLLLERKNRLQALATHRAFRRPIELLRKVRQLADELTSELGVRAERLLRVKRERLERLR